MINQYSEASFGVVVIWSFFFVFTVSLSPSQAGDAERAKAKFLKGTEYIKSENYEAGLKAFEESYRLNPRASALFNIGMCQKALLRYGDAVTTFKRLLKESRDSMDPRLKANAEKDLALIERLVGKLYLKGAPEGAKVMVNEQIYANDPSSEPLILGPGTHSVEITKKDFKPFKVDVTVASGANVVVRVVLKPEEKKEKRVVEVLIEERKEPVPVLVDEKKKITPLFISGIVAGALGLGGVGVGIYFANKYNQDFDDAKDAIKKWNQDFIQKDKDTYNTIKTNKIPKDEAGIAAGFVTGGVLLVTGAVLLLVDGMKEKSNKEGTVSVLPTPGGVTVQF